MMFHYLATLVVVMSAGFGSDLIGQTRQIRVSGRVVDEAHRPLAGVQVMLVHRAEDQSDDQREPVLGHTDQQGRFAVVVPPRNQDRLPWGEGFALRLDAPGRLSARLRPLGSNAHASMSGRREADMGTTVLPTGRPIQVRARRHNGRPLAGVEVLATAPLRNGYEQYNPGTSIHSEFLSRSVTDAKGAAVVYGLGQRGVTMRLRAPGYYAKTIALHGPGLPLVVQMRESGSIRGRVLDHRGKSVIAMLFVSGETGPGGFFAMLQHRKLSAADGSFHFNVDHPNRYVVGALPIRNGSIDNEVESFFYSPVLTGPHDGVEIKLPKPQGVDGGVALTVVDHDTGEPIVAAKAMMLWGSAPEFLLELQFDHYNYQVDAAGKLILPRLVGHGGRAGAEQGKIMVKARGYRTHISDTVKWRADKSVPVIAKMHAEFAVTGTVVNADDGKPLAGVSVWYKASDKNNANSSFYTSMRTGMVLTDTKGRFSLAGLGSSKFKVHYQIRGRPAGETKTLAAAPIDLELKVRRGIHLDGKVTGGPIGTGWRIMLEQTSQQNRFPDSGDSETRWSDVATNGAVSFDGLDSGAYTASLQIQRHDGSIFTIPLPEPLGISDDTRAAQLDISKCMPGRLAGKLELEGPRPPVGQLLLHLSRTDQDQPFQINFGITGLLWPIDPSGAFELSVAAGQYLAQTVDATTGLVLSEEALEVTAGKTTSLSPRLKLALVRVRLVPLDPKGKLVATRLAMQFVEGQQRRNGIDLADMGIPGPGRSLRDGQRELMFYLPAHEVECRVLSKAPILRRGPRPGNKPVELGSAMVTPRLGKITTIEIKVKPPPKID